MSTRDQVLDELLNYGYSYNFVLNALDTAHKVGLWSSVYEIWTLTYEPTSKHYALTKKENNTCPNPTDPQTTSQSLTECAESTTSPD